jgi:hypothetical protein
MKKNKRIKVVHCKTQDQFDTVLKIFDSRGWKWASGMLALDGKSYWKNYTERECLEIKKDFQHSPAEFFIDNSKVYKVISFEEFLKKSLKEGEGLFELNEVEVDQSGKTDTEGKEYTIEELDEIELTQQIANVHEDQEGRYQLTGYDLGVIHSLLCDLQRERNRVKDFVKDWETNIQPMLNSVQPFPSKGIFFSKVADELFMDRGEPDFGFTPAQLMRIANIRSSVQGVESEVMPCPPDATKELINPKSFKSKTKWDRKR